MKFLLSKNRVITSGILLFSLILVSACSTQKMTSEKIDSHKLDKSAVNLTTELDKLPRVNVIGNGRLAKIRLRSGCKPTFLLNGQLEREYSYVYDLVEQSTLKDIRIQSVSDAALFGLRPGGSSIIVIQTE